MERKLKPNTVFDGGAANVLLALDRLTCGYDVVSGNDMETRDRIRAAIRAIGMMLLETVEAEYEPRREFEVTAEALEPRKVTVRVCAENSNEALEKGYAELHDAYTAAIDFQNLDAKEIE